MIKKNLSSVVHVGNKFFSTEQSLDGPFSGCDTTFKQPQQNIVLEKDGFSFSEQFKL